MLSLYQNKLRKVYSIMKHGTEYLNYLLVIKSVEVYMMDIIVETKLSLLILR
nr:MAG TPA: hypothetical protein [Caudoviricetes sp.]